MLDNPELLNMEFATKVAKKMTHDWDVSQRALVVRCDCEFQKGGSRKLSAPGMWDKRALVCGIGYYCRNVSRGASSASGDEASEDSDCVML